MRLQEELPEGDERLHAVLLTLCDQIELLTAEVLAMREELAKVLKDKGGGGSGEPQKKMF